MQAYKKARIELTGRPPGLVLHSSELADDTNKYVIQLKEVIAKIKTTKNVTDELRERKDHLQWRGALGELYTDGAKIFVPAVNLFRATVAAARELSLGTKIEERGAITFMQDRLDIVHDGPDDLEKLYADRRYRLRIPANPNPSARQKLLLPVMRPVFPAWKSEITAVMLPELIDWEKFCTVIELTGNGGIGNARKIGFGKFDVQITEL